MPASPEEERDNPREMTRAEQRRRLAEANKAGLRLLAKVRRPDLLPFSSPRVAEAIGLIEACRKPWRR